ncbi:MAG: hypothetical protein HY815_08815 [Candidatus Riflebacteria bacterium]|nr:hypothetical protein [Candidatus Riflebacteria bacterium]
MSSSTGRKHFHDWAILKYGWLAVFLFHVAFLYFGVREIKIALDIFDKTLLSTDQRRIDHVIQAIYMVTLAFSIILLIIAVFVLEIFRAQRKILLEIQGLKDARSSPAAAAPAGEPMPRPAPPPA